MPPSSTTTGNPRVRRESGQDLRTTARIATTRHPVKDTRHIVKYTDTRMCQINAKPTSNNMNCVDDDCAECYDDMAQRRTDHDERTDHGETMTLYSDNHDASSRTFCQSEPHTFASLYPANPFYYDTPPPSEVPAYYASSTPPSSEVPHYYPPSSSTPSEVPAYYPPSSSPPPSEVPVYYVLSSPPPPTEAPMYYRTAPSTPPPSSPPPLMRTTRTPLQPPTQIEIPAPEWREATPCYHLPTPPPAHQQTIQSPRSLLWRVDFEQDANLQIWDERTQDLLSISFQSIVEALAENRRKEAVTDAFIQQQPHTPQHQTHHQQQQPQTHQLQQHPQEHQPQQQPETFQPQEQPETQQPQQPHVQEEVVTEETSRIANIFQSKKNNVNGDSRIISDLKSDEGKSQNDDVGIATFIKSIDTVIADAEVSVKNARCEVVTKLEVKEEDDDEAMEIDEATIQNKTRVKLSNSERCRLFREKRMRKMKTNEEVLKQLEKRNKMLKETERMLIESKERSQKNCLKVIRGTS